ncbi:hypothetical protein EDD21DRAFT_439880 [Dissophora ornata]|nr:hypothetical protein BGZ58_009776 [Dissophora ornata]KAI8605973.1 hypothetical protein EDD21DRAFT_439880 [Dissophora ornata]
MNQKENHAQEPQETAEIKVPLHVRDNAGTHQQQQEGIQEEQQDEEYDRYKNNPDLLSETNSKATRLFSFDWAGGFVSPFRPTPQDILSNLFRLVEFCTPNSSLLDLGCGDGLVLIQALKTFPRSQLARAIGVDLDRPLLEAAKDKILLDNSGGLVNDDNCNAILSRIELYHGDLITKDDPLASIMTPPTLAANAPATMRELIQDSSHLFVYLLPEALSKLAPLLLEAVKEQQKTVLSMRWEIPELAQYLVHGGSEHHYYIYKS